MPRERRQVLHPSGGVSKTRQSDALASDINHIVGRWITTGTLPVVGRTPTYGDFSNAVDFHTALTRVKDAEAAYWELPVAVRKATENDPGKFLDMVMTPEGRRDLETLGLPTDRVPETAPEPAAKETPAPEEPAPA